MAGIGRADTSGINLPRAVFFFLFLLFFRAHPPVARFLSEVFRFPCIARGLIVVPRKNSLLVQTADKQRVGQEYFANRWNFLFLFFFLRSNCCIELPPYVTHYFCEVISVAIANFEAFVNIGNGLLSTLERSRYCKRNAMIV